MKAVIIGVVVLVINSWAIYLSVWSWEIHLGDTVWKSQFIHSVFGKDSFQGNDCSGAAYIG